MVFSYIAENHMLKKQKKPQCLKFLKSLNKDQTFKYVEKGVTSTPNTKSTL